MTQIDYSALTDTVEYFDPPTASQKDSARRTVCRFARGDTVEAKAADARELMLALGIHPSQEGQDEPPRRPHWD